MGINYKLIGEVIKARRHELKYTQIRLAELVGTAQSYIAEIENGKSKPSLPMLKRIADALQIDLDRLLAEATEIKNDFYLLDYEKEIIEMLRLLPKHTIYEIKGEIKGLIKSLAKED